MKIFIIMRKSYLEGNVMLNYKTCDNDAVDKFCKFLSLMLSGGLEKSCNHLSESDSRLIIKNIQRHIQVMEDNKKTFSHN